MENYTKYALKAEAELLDLLNGLDNLFVIACNKCFKEFESLTEPDREAFVKLAQDNGKTVTSVDFTVLEAINYGGESVTNMLTLAELELTYTEVEEVVKPEEPTEYGQSDVTITMTNEFMPTDDGTNVTKFIQQGNYNGLFDGNLTRDFEFIWDIESNWTAEGKLPEYITLPVTLHVTFNEPSELTEINVYNANKANGYITKAEAYDLGWDSKKGNLWDVAPGMSIGGDYFGNYEGLLPESDDRDYYECDIDFDGTYRNEKRIVYSNDGLIYYTEDHYETFELLYGEE